MKKGVVWDECYAMEAQNRRLTLDVGHDDAVNQWFVLRY